MNSLKTTNRWMLVPALAIALIVFGAALARAQAGDDKPAAKGAWQPPEEDRSAFRDITDYNIFNADRRRIAERVDRERNPPVPRDTETTEPDPVQEDPADPDTRYRLAGISHDAQGPIAYIEQLDTGALSRVQGAADFSQGRITVIGFDTLVYVVDDEERSVVIGQNLTGQRATLAGEAEVGSAHTGDAEAPKPGSREAILKAMRERRERELGNSKPAAPQPEPKPETNEPQPAEQTEPTSGQAVPAGTRSAPTDGDNQ